MLFRQLFDYETFTYTYLIAEDFGKEALLIDPVQQHVEKYLQLLDELDLKLIAALDTHLHADHITAIGMLRKRTGCHSMMGQESKTACVSETFKEGDTIACGQLQLKVMYTPGHTDDSYCFLMPDRVFTGDTLFIRGTGRADFQHGDAGLQYDSIMQKLFTLPDETLVYPGHDYKGMTVTTIREEKQLNPRLAGKSREAYIDLMDNLNLPKPKLMDIAVPANQLCGID